MNALERAAFVDKTLAYKEREMVAEIVLHPSGDHKVELGQVGQHFSLALSLGEAMQAIDLLQRGVQHLQFESECAKEIYRTKRKAVE